MTQPPATTPHPPTTVDIPEWDNNAVQAKDGEVATTSHPGLTGGSKKAALVAKFNTLIPRNRTYLGLRRRTFLIILTCAILAVIALVIGLAVGLTRGSGSQNLPLPTNSEQHTGDLTYYGTGLGSCGITSSDSDMIVAVSHYVFDASSTGSNPNANPLCGQMIRAARYDEEVGARRSVDLKVVDRCVGCAATDIDVSPAAFDKLAARASGRVDVTWAWLNPQATA